MGVIMLTRSDLKNALQLMNISIKIDPGKGRSYFNRAIVHDQMNMKEEAIRDYETALKLDPGMAPDILRNRSVLNLETGKYEQAISDLDALIKLDERNFINYYNRAFAKVMLKDIEGAIEDYKSALKLNPGDEQIIEHIRVLTESGNIN
jgi:tetratricopeptide (TPR) repeat protein